jgi:hypothetical protein
MDDLERGSLRSGARFAARNRPHYSSYRELISHHSRLLENEPAITHRVARIADSRSGNLIQTTVRFRFDSPLIYSTLREVFNELFREHEESSTEGFEVVVTFNAVLTDQESSTFSLFYGQDHRASNDSGAAPELSYGSTLVVRSMLDVGQIPTSFDSETLVRSHRSAFAHSNVSVHSFVNVIFLIYRYVRSDKTSRPSARGGGRHHKKVAAAGGDKTGQKKTAAGRVQQQQQQQQQ